MTYVSTGARDEFSAGGVVYRHGAEGVEVVLVGRRRERLWALPKGKPDGDEAPDGLRVHKRVVYFLMEAVGGDVAAHDHEFDDVVWVHLSEAERLLTHRNQLHILRRVAELTERAA